MEAPGIEPSTLEHSHNASDYDVLDRSATTAGFLESFSKVTIPLGWILTVFLSYHTFPLLV